MRNIQEKREEIFNQEPVLKKEQASGEELPDNSNKTTPDIMGETATAKYEIYQHLKIVEDETENTRLEEIIKTARAIKEDDEEAISKEASRSSQLGDEAVAGNDEAVQQLASEEKIEEILKTDVSRLATIVSKMPRT